MANLRLRHLCFTAPVKKLIENKKIYNQTAILTEIKMAVFSLKY